MWSGQLVKAWFKTVGVLALCSGESELAMGVRAATAGMGNTVVDVGSVTTLSCYFTGVVSYRETLGSRGFRQASRIDTITSLPLERLFFSQVRETRHPNLGRSTRFAKTQITSVVCYLGVHQAVTAARKLH